MTTITALACFALWSGSPVPGVRPEDATLEDLAFLVGAWEAEEGAESMREVWDAPRGDAMVGHFCIVQDGRAVLYELIAIEDHADEPPTMRLRHFGPRLTPWASEADSPTTLPLAEVSDSRAVFADPERDFPRRCIYTLEDEKLTVRLEPAPDSERDEIVITFTRAEG